MQRREANQRGDSGDAASSESAPSSSQDSPQQYQFDWLNWFYWSLWWQQYSYWTWLQHYQGQTHTSSSSSATASQGEQQSTQTAQATNQSGGTQGSWQYNQPNQYYNQFYPYNNQLNQFNTPPYGNWPQYLPAGGQGGVAQGGGTQQPQTSPGLYLRIRLINGFETCIAPFWKRVLAELIDTVLFIFLLKAYFPESDFRVPEILLEGTDVWRDIQEEELDEIHNVLSMFVFSVFVQKLHHAIMESIWLSVFSCTPGKWLLGLRVLRCRSVHLTRTQPGRTVRVDPGGRMLLIMTLSRSLFKSIFSLFCPLLIFFLSLTRGRTKYDEVFRSAVVDVRTLYRPVYSGRGHTHGAAR